MAQTWKVDDRNTYILGKNQLVGKWKGVRYPEKEDHIARGQFRQDFYHEDLFKRVCKIGDIILYTNKAKRVNQLEMMEIVNTTKAFTVAINLANREGKLKFIRPHNFIIITDQLAANAQQMEALLTKDAFIETNI